jgi:hypothetical protein
MSMRAFIGMVQLLEKPVIFALAPAPSVVAPIALDLCGSLL